MFSFPHRHVNLTVTLFSSLTTLDNHNGLLPQITASSTPIPCVGTMIPREPTETARYCDCPLHTHKNQGVKPPILQSRLHHVSRPYRRPGEGPTLFPQNRIPKTKLPVYYVVWCMGHVDIRWVIWSGCLQTVFVAGSQPRTVQSLTRWTILHLTLVMCSVRGEDNNIYYAEVRSQSH